MQGSFRLLLSLIIRKYGSKKYWLKGGLCGVGVTIILFLIAAFALDPNWKYLILLALPIIAAFLIVIGIAIGWAYGKSKMNGVV